MKDNINYKKRQDFYRVLLLFILIFDVYCLGLTFYVSQNDAVSEQMQVSSAKISNEKMVIPCGLPVGIYVKTEGLLVLDTQIITSTDGLNYEPAQNRIKEGDYIIRVNGSKVNSKEELKYFVETSNGNEMKIELQRKEKRHLVSLTPVMTSDGTYKLGIWLRDDTQGLGTITYLDGNRFGALGHGINDYDTGRKMEIEGGSLYEAKILSVKKGERGTPGELVGHVQYGEKEYIGTIESNSEEGIYGFIECEKDKITSQEKIPVGKKGDVKKGQATIRFVLDGESKDYEIKILKVDYSDRNKKQGILFEIVDEELLEKTGGIVQGMSGSPVIQNGKLVGAVTHVLVNDPTRGYAIFIENMLKH